MVKEFSGLILVGVGLLVMILGAAYFRLEVIWIGLVTFFIGVMGLSQLNKDAKRRQDLNAAQVALEAGNLPNCPVCGSYNFSWGEVFANYIHFRSKQGRRMPVLARRCNHCGHVDLFAGTTTSSQLDEGKEKKKRQMD